MDGVLNDLPDDMAGVASSPAAEHLFKTRDEVPKLSPDRAELFHSKTGSYYMPHTESQTGPPDSSGRPYPS
jgi:hypothetical protein